MIMVWKASGSLGHTLPFTSTAYSILEVSLMIMFLIGGDAQSIYSFAANPNPGAIHVNPAVIQPGQQMLIPGGQPVVMPLPGQPNLSLPPPNITSSRGV